jgi:hypothetical protein
MVSITAPHHNSISGDCRSANLRKGSVRKPSAPAKLSLNVRACNIARSLSARLQHKITSPSPTSMKTPKIIETKSISDLQNGAVERAKSPTRTRKARSFLPFSEHVSPVCEIILLRDEITPNFGSPSGIDAPPIHTELDPNENGLTIRSHSVKISKSEMVFTDVSAHKDTDALHRSQPLGKNEQNSDGVFYSALSIANRYGCCRASSTRCVNDRLPRSAGTFSSQKTMTKSGFLSPASHIRSASIANCAARSPSVEYLPMYSVSLRFIASCQSRCMYIIKEHGALPAIAIFAQLSTRTSDYGL